MLSTTQLSVFIRESAWAFPTIESTHVVALALVIGTIAIIDLRLVGWADYTDAALDAGRFEAPRSRAALLHNGEAVQPD